MLRALLVLVLFPISLLALDSWLPAATTVPFSTHVADGIDVTTGTYNQITPDLAVNCHEPIILYRTHVSCKRTGTQAAFSSRPLTSMLSDVQSLRHVLLPLLFHEVFYAFSVANFFPCR